MLLTYRFIMKTIKIIPLFSLLFTLFFSFTLSVQALVVNQWKNKNIEGRWESQSNWENGTVPISSECVNFRIPHALVLLDETVKLDQSIQIYSSTLSISGDGSIVFINPVDHRRSINIPASSEGRSTLTLSGNISIEGRILLAGKGFGYDAGISKGSLILKGASSVKGPLSIGKDGAGIGTVTLMDESSFYITKLDIQTSEYQNGKATINVLSGTLTIALNSSKNPYDVFLQDKNRRIILGKSGTLVIYTTHSKSLKKRYITNLIRQKRIASMNGYLGTPIISDSKIVLRTQHYVAPKKKTPPPKKKKKKNSSSHLIGYIVFLSAILLVLFRPAKDS